MMEKFLHYAKWFLVCVLPGGIVLYLIWSAYLVCLYYAQPAYALNFSATDTYRAALGGRTGVIFTDVYYENETKFHAWLSGLRKIYLLPLILLTPSFYRGIFQKIKTNGWFY